MVSRSGGRSSVAAAAYRAGEELRDHRQGLTHDYSRRAGVVSAEILLPEGAPAELADRGTLWNAVEGSEKRIDSQVARDFMIAIPHQLTPEEGRRALVRFANEQLVSKGMVVDLAIHRYGSPVTQADGEVPVTKGEGVEVGKKRDTWKYTQRLLDQGVPLVRDGDPIPDGAHVLVTTTKDGTEVYRPYQPHGHILSTTRGIDVTSKTGFSAKKDRSWNDQSLVETWRESCAQHFNVELEAAGSDVRVDHRSQARREAERALAATDVEIAQIDQELAAVQAERQALEAEVKAEAAKAREVLVERDLNCGGDNRLTSMIAAMKEPKDERAQRSDPVQDRPENRGLAAAAGPAAAAAGGAWQIGSNHRAAGAAGGEPREDRRAAASAGGQTSDGFGHQAELTSSARSGLAIVASAPAAAAAKPAEERKAPAVRVMSGQTDALEQTAVAVPKPANDGKRQPSLTVVRQEPVQKPAERPVEPVQAKQVRKPQEQPRQRQAAPQRPRQPDLKALVAERNRLLLEAWPDGRPKGKADAGAIADSLAGYGEATRRLSDARRRVAETTKVRDAASARLEKIPWRRFMARSAAGKDLKQCEAGLTSVQAGFQRELKVGAVDRLIERLDVLQGAEYVRRSEALKRVEAINQSITGKGMVPDQVAADARAQLVAQNLLQNMRQQGSLPRNQTDFLRRAEKLVASPDYVAARQQLDEHAQKRRDIGRRFDDFSRRGVTSGKPYERAIQDRDDLDKAGAELVKDHGEMIIKEGGRVGEIVNAAWPHAQKMLAQQQKQGPRNDGPAEWRPDAGDEAALQVSRRYDARVERQQAEEMRNNPGSAPGMSMPGMTMTPGGAGSGGRGK